MDLGLTGKTALVLGASRGLGAASAKELALEGSTVFAAARDAGRIADWSSGLDVTPMELDLSDTASVDALIGQMKGQGIDILVNNSGGPAAGPARGQAPDNWSTSFATMAMPLMRITDALLPGMIEQEFGRVITIGSSGIIAPIPNLALSNGVRSALAGWSKTLAAEVASKGVTVNMVLPGRIGTDRVRQLDEGKAKREGKDLAEVEAASRATIPAGRYGRPEEFAATVAFLASERASYITGSMIRVDGGMLKNL